MDNVFELQPIHYVEDQQLPWPEFCNVPKQGFYSSSNWEEVTCKNCLREKEEPKNEQRR